MFAEAETWVAVAFLLFMALLIYLKAPAMLVAMLDERSARIAKELAEARKLREEAGALLAEYKGKRAEAENTASSIIEQAKKEAEAYAIETRQKLAETIERRTRQAEQKIAQAEVQAVKDVRATITDLAIAAATELLGSAAKGAEKCWPLLGPARSLAATSKNRGQMTDALQSPPARTGLPRVVAALGVFVAWVAVTVFAPRLLCI